ncbi:hypothetical protein HU200_010720 [Digitaria exilis]|uniref:F-box associated domain-containing protein n=1 Tax=Digitaria exilis TaxID=1010633 RepID=A0A835FHD7_9POAL|nr:hypothetical protein HU200_010720 [Digitaria exilis]
MCLCDNTKRGGAIALLNPSTREKLRVPPLPVSYRQRKGYRSWQTLQRAAGVHAGARRDVAVPGASCRPDAGVVTVGGAAYWVTNGLERVVCFDLKSESVTFDAPLPVGPGRGYEFHLTEVHDGRLGLAVHDDRRAPPVRTEEVWVLGDRHGWTLRYRVRAHGVEQRLAAPYLAPHGGEYVLAVARSDERGRKNLCAHRLPGAGIWLPRGEVRSVRISDGEPGTVVAYCISGSYSDLRTFAYVETTEPLSCYKIHRGSSIPRGSTRK